MSTVQAGRPGVAFGRGVLVGFGAAILAVAIATAGAVTPSGTSSPVAGGQDRRALDRALAEHQAGIWLGGGKPRDPAAVQRELREHLARQRATRD